MLKITSQNTLIHSAGTKFYHVVALAPADGSSQSFVIRRWGKISVIDSGGQIKISRFASVFAGNADFIKEIARRRSKEYIEDVSRKDLLKIVSRSDILRVYSLKQGTEIIDGLSPYTVSAFAKSDESPGWVKVVSKEAEEIISRGEDWATW